MVESYRKNAHTAFVTFLLLYLFLLIYILLNLHRWYTFHYDPVIHLGNVAGFIIALIGDYYYAKSKGYSGWWALLFFLHFIGFIILLCLPDRTKKTS